MFTIHTSILAAHTATWLRVHGFDQDSSDVSKRVGDIPEPVRLPRGFRGVSFSIIDGTKTALDYREDHRGIPFRIALFMNIARALAFLVTVVPFILLLALLLDTTIAGWVDFAASIVYAIGTNTIADVWTPLGFRMFRWMITKR